MFKATIETKTKVNAYIQLVTAENIEEEVKIQLKVEAEAKVE